MNAVFRLLCAGIFALLITLSDGSVLAHGEKPHGEPDQAVAESIVEDSENAGSSQLPSSETAIDGERAAQASPLDVITMLHPATVHFPIALLIVAAMLEALLLFRPRSGLEPTIRIILYIAAAGTIVAALFGWIHTGMWMGGEALMQRHRWVGTGLAVFSLGLVWLASRPPDRGRAVLRISLAVAAIAVVFQGYWGAELSHGPNHLSQTH